MKANRGLSLTALAVLAIGVLGGSEQSLLANERPVAEAGPLRYAGADPIRLDGTASYDPDRSGPLHYTWRQLSGPAVTMTDANTAEVLISGPLGPVQPGARGQAVGGPFVQTQSVQECLFELVVSDGELTSLPATVKMIIVPFYGVQAVRLENAPFDPNKPTLIYFGGGDCITGSGSWNDSNWASKANILSFASYSPDAAGGVRTYYKYGDMIIVYLSSVAPDYRQLIQTAGWSTGGQPAVDVGLQLNLTYRDARYAVNRVTFLDATPYCRPYPEAIARFLTSAVDGEQCWVDNNVGQNTTSAFFPNVLNVASALSHAAVPAWVRTSLTDSTANAFNHGLVAGAYWSIIGPGKNLQLASTPDQQTYMFKWISSISPNYLDFYNRSSYPARLPEPVTLGAWVNRSKVTGAIDGAVLSCRYSENAVGYQLLFGSDPYRVMDFRVVSDTPAPPMEILREFPAGQDWWTVRVRDQYGSTIYADPVRLDLTNLPSLSVQNTRTGKRYGLIEHAIREAQAGDGISLDPGTYEENIEFHGQSVTVRSLAPDDPALVAATVIRGQEDGPAVVFSGPESANCVLAGLTIRSDTVAVSCRDAVPTIRNCVLGNTGSIAVEFWWGRQPHLVACTLLGQAQEGGDPGLIAYWKLDEAAGTVAVEGVGASNSALLGAPVWQPAGGKIGGALQLDGVDDYVQTSTDLNPVAGPFSVFAWVKGGTPGQAIVSQTDGINWLAVAPGGVLKTDLRESTRSGKPLISSTVITGGTWHRVGLTWDGSQRVLYVDGTEIAKDATALSAGLASSAGSLRFGAGSTLAAGTFWSGLIDDVRIYNQAVKP